MSKKIGIIGANSYIARNVIWYIEKNYPDAVLALYDYRPEQVDGRAGYRQINILERDSLRDVDFDCDILYVFAGKTGSANGFEEYDAFIDINERALLNIVTEYRRQGSSAKIVFPSTRLVYKGRPGALAEDAEKEFKTIYAINKFACETYLQQYHNVFGVNYCIFRICVPYGTMISNASSYGTAEFMMGKASKGENISLYGDGSVRRTLTYMGDLIETLVEGAMADRCINDVYNIGGEDLSLREMAEMIAVKYGVKVEYVPWPDIAEKIESGDTVFDSTKLDSIIGRRTTGKFADWIRDFS